LNALVYLDYAFRGIGEKQGLLDVKKDKKSQILTCRTWLRRRVMKSLYNINNSALSIENQRINL
jgi:hypothetical protein